VAQQSSAAAEQAFKATMKKYFFWVKVKRDFQWFFKKWFFKTDENINQVR
jgi:hypothetical protein